MKLTSERLWWLKKFGAGGWTIGNGMLCTVKKWQAHSAALVKMGLLETTPEDQGHHYYRITEAGRAALEKP